jgi:hypothetical protein
MAQINKPSEYFNTKLYSGSGSTTTLTGVGFQPDWTWIKRRNSSINHKIYDAVRTAGKSISSNNTAAEITNDAEGYLSAFTSDGFTVQAGTTSDEYVNQTGGTYVAWNWLANGAGVSNTDGSIASTVSANTTSGFSIVTWSGTSSNGTIGHGLGVAPKVIICFGYSSGTNSWTVGHNSLSWNNGIYLETGTSFSNSTLWNNTAPTNDVFSVGSFSGTNSSQSMIAYCFAEKKGFSKFGSYTGNGNANGPFVYTGFKPAFVLVKNVSASNNWFLQDNKRAGYNGANYLLKPNISGDEDLGTHIDILSNGFKTIVSSANCNGSGNNIIYMAFAEQPLVGTNNIPATAR